MLAELKKIEAQLKQILYGCVEHVQATKAALYLPASHDLNDKKFELVTHYQYNAADRKLVTANDDLVDRLAVKRTPFFINGLGADQRLAEMLFNQGNDRILAAPLFSRGRLIGFIDMRDKAGKKPFDNRDVDAAKTIADQMLNALAANKLFGVGPIALVDDNRPNALLSGPLQAAVPVPQAVHASSPGQVFSADALRAIESARQYLSKRQHAVHPAARRATTEADLTVVRMLLPATLAIPGAAVAALSAAGSTTNPHAAVAVGPPAGELVDAMLKHLQAWLQRANHAHMTAAPQFLYPFGTRATPVVASGITTIVTAPLHPQAIDGLLLTVAFERVPEAQAQQSLHVFLQQMAPSVEAAIASASGRYDRSAVAEQLLEPDFRKYPQLADHAHETAIIAQRFARVLELPATQAETIRIAALVHDVGLRLLDYERLYRKANLTAEEMRGLAEHPLVGAALVEPILGSDVAQAVLRHHERVDGKGYPSRMGGQQIPLTARILAVVDAWVAMTARTSYQIPISREQAMARLREGAGTQWDAAIVERFLRALPDITS
ncbi:MAG TPA: HD domain-containing phosphohydrolase [Thermoanaerobaculia bacterium]|nr:HD domain-containing phosphohydrolase [Thermoanaerobaculia bacterium]